MAQWIVTGLVIIGVLGGLVHGLVEFCELEQAAAAYIDKPDDPAPVPCENCGREAVHYCETCQWWFCDRCWDEGHLCVDLRAGEWKVAAHG